MMKEGNERKGLQPVQRQALEIRLIIMTPIKNGTWKVPLNGVRMIGIEPTWVTPLDPKSSASASFATSACFFKIKYSNLSLKGLQK